MRTILAVVCLMVGSLIVAAARITFALSPLQGIGTGTLVRKPLLTADIAPPKVSSRVEIKQLDFRPLQTTGVHIHPVPVVGYISKGKITFQIEGQPARTLHAGDACFEPANVKILHFDNPSASDDATYIALYIMGEDDREVIHMVNP